jgi:putative PIN family toxin of toxin-antitoxin system
MKILFDTNVVISSLLTKGMSFEVLKYAKKRHNVFVSDFVIKEVRDKLENKLKFSDKEIEKALSFLNTHFQNVEVEKIERVCRDREDDNILSAALKIKADVIITGDDDLLVLKRYKSIDIIKPSDFWRYEIEKQGD